MLQFVGLKKNHFLCSQIQKKMGNIKIIRGVFDTELELKALFEKWGYGL